MSDYLDRNAITRVRRQQRRRIDNEYREVNGCSTDGVGRTAGLEVMKVREDYRRLLSSMRLHASRELRKLRLFSDD